MAFPDDILLPANAKTFGFVDSKYAYNTHWDLNWSFTFALSGNEHAFTTFLTRNPVGPSEYGGQYLGYFTNQFESTYILTEDDEELLDETSSSILYNSSYYGSPYILSEDGYVVLSEGLEPLVYNGDPTNLLVIAFDSTGKFALPISNNPGLPLSAVKNNALIIRDYSNNIIFNESLSSLSTEFVLSSSISSFQTLRFRLANSSRKLSIDYKFPTTEYKLLTSITLSIPDDYKSDIYPGFSFCSPISSLLEPSTLILKNFHVQGNTTPPTYEIKSYTPLTITNYNNYTSISGISAQPNTR